MNKYIFVLLAVVLVPFSAHAAIQTTMTIEQVSPSEYGVWTFLYSDGTSISSSDAGINAYKHSFTVTNFEPMTISVTQPAGTTAKISIYRNGDLLKTETIPQFSFTPYPNEDYRFVVQYSLTQLGDVGITSDPSGVRFRMKGVTRRTYSAKTPFTFTNIPAGKYTLLFARTRVCLQPAPRTAVVEPGNRNTVHISLICNVDNVDAVDQTRGQSKRSIVEAAKLRDALLRQKLIQGLIK